MSWLRRLNAGSQWLAFKLALVFGFVWTVWLFFVIPLIAPFFPPGVQAQVFYYGSGWVQLFALPLLTWIGNKTQNLADQAQKQQVELLERNTRLTEQNNQLTDLVRGVAEQNARLIIQVQDSLSAVGDMTSAVSEARQSQERSQAKILAHIEAVVTSNNRLATTIEGFSRDSNALAHSIEGHVSTLTERLMRRRDD